MCVSCIAPAKTNAQGYRHADYALPDTRVFVMHSTHIFSNSLLKPKMYQIVHLGFGELGEGDKRLDFVLLRILIIQ